MPKSGPWFPLDGKLSEDLMSLWQALKCLTLSKDQHKRLAQCEQDVKNTGPKDFPLVSLVQALPPTFVNKLCTISWLILIWEKSAE